MANTYTTVPGALYGEGVSSLVELANKYQSNPEISGLVVGSLADSFKTQTNTALSLQYNDAYQGSLAKYQEAIENLRKGNTMELMGSEAAITEKLASQQIGGQKDLANIQSDTTRYGYDQDLKGIESQVQGQLGVAKEQAGASRFGSEKDFEGVKEQAGATRYAAGEQAGAQRFAAEKEAESSQYASKTGLEGVKEQASASRFGADVTSARGLEGQKYGYDSQERQISLSGEEERKSTTNKYARETESQIGLRADARGAIAKAGSRFYG